MLELVTSWSKFFQENFDKLLLTFLFIFCVFIVLHMIHDGKDTDNVLWGREMTGTALGALLGLITGHALAAAKTTATTAGNPPKTVITTET